MLVPSSNGINVDSAYSRIFEPTLHTNSFLVPGVSCTDKFTMNSAGQISVHKLPTNPIEPGTPGRDFSHTLQTDDLIPIVLNNNYMTSRKLYQVALNEIGAPMASATLQNATEDAREGLEQSALSCLATEITATIAGGAVNKTTCKDLLLRARGEISKKKGNANIVLASPDFYTALLQQAGAEFTPVHNDLILTNGRVGSYYGFTIFEVNAIDAGTSFKYYNNASSLVSVTTANMKKNQFIMYDYEALSVIKNLAIFRMIDGGKDFNGTLAQVELNAGLKVTTPDRGIRVTTDAS